MLRRRDIRFFWCLGAVLIGVALFLGYARPRVPDGVEVPTAEDLLVIRAVLVHHAVTGNALGLTPPTPEGQRPIEPKELAGLAGRVLVIVAPRASLGGLRLPSNPDALYRDLWSRNLRFKAASLERLALPWYMSFTDVTEPPSGRHPDGSLIFSLPGYSRDRAIVHVAVTTPVAFGLREGGGVLVTLQRLKGRWQVVASHGAAIS